MPAVSIDGNSWEIESSKILQTFGYHAISKNEMMAIQGTWQGVLNRANNPFKFFTAWAQDADSKSPFIQRSTNNFLLSFSAFYMFVLINLTKIKLKIKKPKNFGDQYLFWEAELKNCKSSFLDGNTMIIGFPLTLPLVIWCMRKVPR